jgi:hypothetical protein
MFLEYHLVHNDLKDNQLLRDSILHNRSSKFKCDSL